jgi:hypothetical protein
MSVKESLDVERGTYISASCLAKVGTKGVVPKVTFMKRVVGGTSWVRSKFQETANEARARATCQIHLLNFNSTHLNIITDWKHKWFSDTDNLEALGWNLLQLYKVNWLYQTFNGNNT